MSIWLFSASTVEIKFKNTNWIQQMAHINQVLFKVNFEFKVKTCVSWVNSFMYNRFYTSNKPPIPILLGNYICDPNFCETLLRSSSVILNPILFLHIDVLGRVEQMQSNHRSGRLFHNLKWNAWLSTISIDRIIDSNLYWNHKCKQIHNMFRIHLTELCQIQMVN